MKKISIPDTNLEAAPLGLGCVNAGLAWKGSDAAYLFDAFLDMGGSVYDTARVYSDWIPGEAGRSEQVVGEWLNNSKKRNHIVLMSKGGHPDMTKPAPDMYKSRMSPEDMRHDLELSLKALHTEWLDVYFYHRDNPDMAVEELIETMECFVKEGKIRYYACSNWSAERIKSADDYSKKHQCRGFIANEVLYNLGTKNMKPPSDDSLQSMNEEMHRYHVSNPGNLAIPYTGICGGFFSKLIEQGTEAVKDSPYYTKENVELAEVVRALALEYSVTPLQVVLGFFKTREFNCLPLYSPRNAENLKEAFGAFDIPFTKEDYEV